jgi:CO/xanthine dehydrogenase Mo-binding subunit
MRAGLGRHRLPHAKPERNGIVGRVYLRQGDRRKTRTNMFEYKKPTILDFGPIETYAVETRSGNACYGASGISHCMAAPLLPVCAVANAIGKWIAPPATPDKILQALGKA